MGGDTPAPGRPLFKARELCSENDSPEPNRILFGQLSLSLSQRELSMPPLMGLTLFLLRCSNRAIELCSGGGVLSCEIHGGLRDSPGEIPGDGEGCQVLADVVLLEDVHVAGTVQRASPAVLDPLQGMRKTQDTRRGVKRQLERGRDRDRENEGAIRSVAPVST